MMSDNEQTEGAAVVTTKNLDAFPPPPLSHSDRPSTQRSHGEDSCPGSTLNADSNADGKSTTNQGSNVFPTRITYDKDNNSNPVSTQTPKPTRTNITVACSPHKTPVSIARYIQNAQNELDQMTHHDSPKTPCKDIASPDLLEYIRSTEKEMDQLLKETLASPTINRRSDSMDASFANLDGLKRDLSFQYKMSLDDESVDSKCCDDNAAGTDEDRKRETKNTISLDSLNIGDGKNSNKRETKSMLNLPNVQTGEGIKNGKTSSRGPRLKVPCKAVLLICFVTSTLLVLLGSIYPASPLLEQNMWSLDECNLKDHVHVKSYFSAERYRLGLATFSFVVATSIRTVVSAPLQRLDDSIKRRQSHFQLISQILHHFNKLCEKMEMYSYWVWEETATNHRKNAATPFKQPPEIDLGTHVPCNANEARKYLIHRQDFTDQHDNFCPLRDVISLDLLMEFAATNFDSDFDLATHPLVLRNLWPDEVTTNRRLTPSGMLKDPQLSNFILPNYFSDATKTGYDALVPDSNPLSLSQFVRNIQSGETPRAKIGTQSIVEAFPSLREEIVPSKLAKKLFGWNPWLDEFKERVSQDASLIFKRLLQILPPSTYYPIFIAGVSPSQQSELHSRTDLHTEPIGNIAVQLHGYRHWTLVPAKWSGLLRPTVSKHGRGYIYSSLDPITELPSRLEELHLVWQCVTNQGDAVWIPPWMWHRVDYTEAAEDGIKGNINLSIGASVFHFYPKLYALNFPLFAFVIIPNLIWEALGLNIE